MLDTRWSICFPFDAEVISRYSDSTVAVDVK